jgi:hypothetical protein
MVRFTTIVAFSALCILPNAASADPLKRQESSASDFSSRQRCACTTWHRSARVAHYRHWRIRTVSYLIGYDPLPYRFGSTFIWERPYRYYWR